MLFDLYLRSFLWFARSFTKPNPTKPHPIIKRIVDTFMDERNKIESAIVITPSEHNKATNWFCCTFIPPFFY
jgi:hypothetical protein